MADRPVSAPSALFPPEREAPGWVEGVFLAAVFCLPWSSDMGVGAGWILSQGFNVAMIVLVVHWLTRSGAGIRSQPKAYSWFGAFMLLHSLVFYGLFHPAELSWSTRTIDFGFATLEQISILGVLARLIVYVLFGYAVAALISERRLIVLTGGGLALSLLLVSWLGGGVQDADARAMGGYANANSFAEVCLVALLANLGLLLTGGDSGRRVLGAAGVLIAMGLMFMSGSRSAILAFGVGALGLARGLDPGRRAMVPPLLLVGLGAVWLLTGGGAFEALLARLGDGKQNLRLLIWLAYAGEWRDFLGVGVGVGREMTVLKEPIFMDKIWPPHNTFLRVTVQFGVLGLLLLLGLFRSYVVGLWWATARRGRWVEGALALGLVLVWLVLMGSGDRMNSRAFWLSLGVVGGMLGRREETGW